MENTPSQATYAPPRVLLVEDDPVSQHYLASVLQSLSLQVDLAADARTAQALAATHPHALWMIDVNLPDASGPELLAALRQAHPDTPALAHTADNSTALAGQLRGLGFADVLVKPLDRQRLHQAIAARLPPLPVAGRGTVAVAEELPLWDDARALTALNGQAAHLKALRDLFLNELPGVRQQLLQACTNEDLATLRQHLHRLQASCGFVGAARLGQAARALHHDPGNPACRQETLEAISALLPA